jgi:hypothetical protein
VSGALLLGAQSRPIPDEIIVNPQGNELAEAFAAQEAEAARSAQILEAGWLGSLHGLEALELTGQLRLFGIAAPDLSAFESLRSLSDHPVPSDSGSLEIERAKNLLDLRGLESVTGISTLRISQNPLLQSLDGVELSARMESVTLQGNPQLTDLTALSSIDTIGSLTIIESGVENLDALVNLGSGSATFIANPELSDVSGLADLELAQQVIFMSNPKLASIPEFLRLGGVEQFFVLDNAALRSVSLNFQLAFSTTSLDAAPRFSGERPPRIVDREIESGSAWFDISDNPQLENIAIRGNLTSALAFEVSRNAGLSSIDLGSLRSLNVLSIAGNATLSEVALGDIQTVNLLSVVDNPNLAAAGLRGVRTFETVTRGNADDSAE